MDINEAVKLGRRLISEHLGNTWHLELDQAVTRFGATRCSTHVITLSRPLTLVNSEEVVHYTILHEIAHALAGPGAGHGRAWQAQCYRLGIAPKRCLSAKDGAESVEPKYILVCPHCGEKRAERHRQTKTRRACGACCKRYNRGRFHPDFELLWRHA